VNRLAPGFVLCDRYRLIDRVATGGMGQVWSAADDVLERKVAIKIMHPQTEQQQALARRLRAEARFAAQISHPNIVEVFDFGEHDGLAFLVMELIEGPTLGKVLADEGPLGSAQARALVVQLAGALARAHESGIIHRDLKPSNVLIAPGGLVKLMDFGIAKDANATVHTAPGEVYGTTYYLSPEQALGERVTAASDLYSLGVLAHELLTGAKPFDRGTPIATALATVAEPPPPLPDGVEEELRAVVMACLAKDPADRPTASGVLEALTEPEPLAARRLVAVGEVAGDAQAGGDDVLEPTQEWTPPRRAL